MASSSHDATPPLHQQSAGEGREKKRVSFRPGSESNIPATEALEPDQNETPSPHHEQPVLHREDFDREHVSSELERILHSESRARPVRSVLRNRGQIDTPPEAFDEDEASSRSGAAARQRAGKLAQTLGGPQSHTRSQTASSTNAHLDNHQELHDITTDDEGPDNTEKSHSSTSEALEHTTSAEMDAQEKATDLVRSWTHRDRKGENGSRSRRRSQADHSSGTTTPNIGGFDYVPRPEKYHGSILGALMGLVTDSKQEATSGRGSTASTPDSTPPSSPPETPRGDGDVRRRSAGLFNHRNNGSSSSLTLGNLVQSSSGLVAPGSSEISHILPDQIKQKRKAHKSTKGKKAKEKQKRKITKHIAGIILRHRYLLALCRALMIYGAPTHRLETYLKMSARALEIDGQFMYIPGVMLLSFDDSETHTTEVKIVRAAGGVDLGRMHEVHELYKRVIHDQMGVEEATEQLNDIMARPPHFPVPLRVILSGVASAAVAPFGFSARWIDLPFAFLLGCVLGFLQFVLGNDNELYANVFEIVAALLTSFLARALGSIQGGSIFCFSALAQSSIALILPGYMILLSSLELQSHQMLAGSVRLVYSVIYTLFLGYGITIGTALYGYMDKHATSKTTCDGSLNGQWNLLFVVIFTVCLAILNQAKWKQMPMMIFLSFSGYAVNHYASNYFGGSGLIGPTFGALTIGTFANLYSRLGRHLENFSMDTWDQWGQPAVDGVKSLVARNRRPRTHPEVGQVPGLRSKRNPDPEQAEGGPGNPENEKAEQDPEEPRRRPRAVGYSLAAAVMLPAIFVQVPSGLAVSGSLLSGISTADSITHNASTTAAGPSGGPDQFTNSAFGVLISVIQVAISISVGLSLSALLVYPFGKKNSAVSSF
jgi:uncharacterized membrane protein YjjP (DUF1212 family)